MHIKLSIYWNCIIVKKVLNLYMYIGIWSGVDDVVIDLSMQKVTVMGWAEQKKILKAVRRHGRTAELWPYPYNPQYHGFIDHYHNYLQSPQHHQHQPHQHQPQPQTKPIITYHSLSSSSSSSSHKHTREYNSYNYNGFHGGRADYSYYQEPPFSTIDEEAGAMFSDENPHSCSIMWRQFWELFSTTGEWILFLFIVYYVNVFLKVMRSTNIKKYIYKNEKQKS